MMTEYRRNQLCRLLRRLRQMDCSDKQYRVLCRVHARLFDVSYTSIAKVLG